MLSRGGGRNRALKSSSGEYICFVDSDDWVDVQFVEKLYSTLSSTKSDIVTADYFEYKDGNLREISHLGKNLQCPTLELKRKILLNGCRLWTSIFKRDLIFDNNLFFPEGVIYEDNAVGPALFLSAKKIHKIDDSLYYYRRNSESTTNKINDYRFFDRLKTSVLALENIRNLPNYESELISLKEEIEWMFIKLYFMGTLFGTLSRFKPIPIDRINLIFNRINDYSSTWTNNRYYRNSVSIFRKLLIKLLYYFPQTTCIIVGKILNIRRLT